MNARSQLRTSSALWSYAGADTDSAGGGMTTLPAEDLWRGGAVCAQTDPDAFFPEKGASTAAAKRICRDCPVTVECLQSAIVNDERFGVWGGLSERERRRHRRRPR